MKTIQYILTIAFLMLAYLGFSQCQGDCENGTGIMVFPDGNKYQGEFKDGMRNGKGTFVWTSGAKYNGAWLDDKMHGFGTYIYPDRRHYKGEFKNGVKHGTGTLFTADQKVIQEGKWVDDQYVAVMKYKYVNLGASFLGESHFPILPNPGTCNFINPVGLSFDYSINEYLGVGGYLGYSTLGFEGTVEDANGENQSLEADYNYYFLGLRVTGSYNLFNSDRLQPYAGLMGGYGFNNNTLNNIAIENEFVEELDNNLYWNAFIGLRAFFTENIGVFAEGGVGLSNLTAGLTYRF